MGSILPGGDYIAQGISSFGRSIGGAFEDWKKKHDEITKSLAESGVLHDYGSQHGYFTPEQETKYAAASANEKANMTDAFAKTIALGQADQFHKESLANAIKVAQIAAASRGGDQAPLGHEQFGQAQQAAGKQGIRQCRPRAAGCNIFHFKAGR